MPEGEAKEIERQALQNFIFGVKGNEEEFPTLKSRFLGKNNVLNNLMAIYIEEFGMILMLER